MTPTRIFVSLAPLLALACFHRPNTFQGDPSELTVDASPAGVRPGSGDGPGGSSPGATDGPAPSGVCEPGPCTVPSKPCVVGMSVCQPDGTSICEETAKLRANGSPCGSGETVCSDGVCAACRAGVECPLSGPGTICKRGAIDCASGKPECLEVDLAPNGAACGQGLVCKDGVCAACAAGEPCQPTNPCHEGMLECAAGSAVCRDSGRARAAGDACGVGKVCGPTGDCVTCPAGMTCDPGEPCKTGKIECASGAPKCVVAGNAPGGTVCGTGRVCREGACEACADGATCTPGNRCHAGILSCATGNGVCMDTGRNLANGTGCGTNQFCSNGTCGTCVVGSTCTPSNPCRTGRTSCATGTSECEESGNAPDGRSCGTNQFCRAGACQFCNQGGTCTPATCKTGAFTCGTGTAVCAATGNVPDRTGCGTNRECVTGTCVDCGLDNNRCCGGSFCRSAGFECRGDRCVRRCGPADGQCPAGCGFAQDADCTRPNGQSCSAAAQCQSGRCTGGVCCNTGQNGCGGRCVAGDDVTACGTGCVRCGTNELCRNGRCELDCGNAAGKRCCPSDNELGGCGPNFICRGQDNTCAPCGGNEQFCCLDQEGFAISCRAPLMCVLISCFERNDCGFLEQQCCPGRVCHTSGGCDPGTNLCS